MARYTNGQSEMTQNHCGVGSNPTRATTNGVMNRWHIGTPFKIYVLSMTIKGLIYERGVIDSIGGFEPLGFSLSLDVRAKDPVLFSSFLDGSIKIARKAVATTLVWQYLPVAKLVIAHCL